MNGEKKTKVIRVLGRSESGKTTFIDSLIPQLKPMRVGVIKHSRHSMDNPPTTKDTGKHFASGAVLSAGIFSGGGEIFFQGEEIPLHDLIRVFEPHVDLILLEGARGWVCPTILLGEMPPESFLGDVVLNLPPKPRLSPETLAEIRRFINLFLVTRDGGKP